jgi:hypothetical protein
MIWFDLDPKVLPPLRTLNVTNTKATITRDWKRKDFMVSRG